MKKLLKLILTISCIFTLIPIHEINAETLKTSEFTELGMWSETNDDEIMYFVDNSSVIHAIAYGGYEYSDGYYLLGFIYAAQTVNKANYIDISSYTQTSDTKVTYNNTLTISTKGNTEAVFVYDINEEELDQKYIYLSISVYTDPEDEYYDSTLDVKILNPFYLTSLTTETNVYLKKGDTYQIELTSKPENAYTGNITYTSSSTSVASVTNGKVTANKEGTAVITIKTATGKTLKVNVYINSKDFPFYDVNPTDWYRDTVKEVYDLGLLTGATETLFKPNVKMNRGMVAIVLHRMEGAEPTEFQQFFKDVDGSSDEYYASSVTWAKKNGVINGYGDNTFRPLKEVSREEMAQMLYNFAIYKGIDVEAEADLSVFNDGNSVSTWHKDAMMWANANGIITGKNNGTRLDPQGKATRAECSKMLLNTYKIIYK